MNHLHVCGWDVADMWDVRLNNIAKQDERQIGNVLWTNTQCPTPRRSTNTPDSC